MRASARLIAAAILTFASLAHAQETPFTPVTPLLAQPKDFRLVWLISDRAGKPLGVFAFPEHLPLIICARRAFVDMYGQRPRTEQLVGNYISDMLGVPLAPAAPVCLTDAELAGVVSAVKVQTDTVGEGA